MTPEEFWNQGDVRRDQKFYVAFCLLESALGDYAVARDLHSHNKLNWASTVYYYSMVHALRLICFIAVGDFPTGHSELARLYKDGTCRNRGWLSHFVSGRRGSPGRVDFNRAKIIRSFNGDKLDLKMGKILDKARECRNDSNYEGLIIAHEHAHRRVIDDFIRLAQILRDTCEKVLPEVVSLFERFIDKQIRKEFYYSYLNWKEKSTGLYYLENSLKFRLLGGRNVRQINNPRLNFSPTFDMQNGRVIINEVLEWIRPLKKSNTDTNLAEEVWNNIKLEAFGGKNLLMQDFRRNIDELKSLESEWRSPFPPLIGEGKGGGEYHPPPPIKGGGDGLAHQKWT